MAPIVPLIPAALGLASTIVQAATRPSNNLPAPRRLDLPSTDEELREAARRKGRQIFAGQTLLEGEEIGASRTMGVADTTLIGSP